MTTHPRPKLGLAARHELVKTIAHEDSIRAGARIFNVSPATAKKWWDRWLKASEVERRTLLCLHDRSSRPQRSPNELPAAEQERICEVRRHTGWGPWLIAGVVGRPHSTVHATLRRHGISRGPRPPKEQVVRYEWPCPGDLLHMDTKRYARFTEPGHAVPGDRSRRNRHAGYEWVHSIVDDLSRLAYSELHRDERAGTMVGFVRRALACFEAHGIRVRRLMTDNHFSYTQSHALAELLQERSIRHLTTQPYRPQTNGKVERFQQTMAREWAYGLAYRSSEDRARAMAHWLRYYNEQRPTAQSGTGRRSAVFTTSPVRTSSRIASDLNPSPTHLLRAEGSAPHARFREEGASVKDSATRSSWTKSEREGRECCSSTKPARRSGAPSRTDAAAPCGLPPAFATGRLRRSRSTLFSARIPR